MKEIEIVSITIRRNGQLEKISVGDLLIEDVEGHPRVRVVEFDGGPDIRIEGTPETEFSGVYHCWPPTGLKPLPALEKLAEAAE